MRFPWLVMSLAGTGFSQQLDYFPLQAGNQWIYRTTFAGSQSLVAVEVTGVREVAGKTYSIVRGLETQPLLLRSSAEGDLFRLDERSGQELPWALLSTSTGESYKTAIDPCSPLAKVESREAHASVPAGEFDGAISVAYTTSCADAGLTKDVFVPNVGLVERSSTTIAGPRTLRLSYARIAGFLVLSEPELSFSMSLDQSVYVIGGAVGVRQPSMQVRLTLRNTTSRPLTLNFNSGQRFDLVIRNEAGDVLYTWSADKSFTMELGTETVANGERNWTITVPVRPAGRLIAEAWLTASGTRRYSASVGFEVLAAP